MLRGKHFGALEAARSDMRGQASTGVGSQSEVSRICGQLDRDLDEIVMLGDKDMPYFIERHMLTRRQAARRGALGRSHAAVHRSARWRGLPP